MKAIHVLQSLLPMAAVALTLTACSSDDSLTNLQMPAAPAAESTTIHYTASVSDDFASTRATVESNNKTLYFATGDKLYITGTNISGVLTIKTGVGTASGSFEGDLTYTGDGTPSADLPLTATLVSAQQSVGTQVSVSAAGAVSVNYPSAAYCTSVNDAVQKYSNLTGTSTYGEKSFTLNQQTAFLNFVITFDDGTATGTELSAVVSNGGSAIATANVTTTTEDSKVVAKFVLPVAKGTTLSSATVKMGDKTAISFGASQTLSGKVYNVKKTYAAAAPDYSTITTADIGKVIGADGNIYDTKTAAETAGTTAVAMIAYVGSGTGHVTYTHGLAIALADEGSMNWDTAKSTCEGKTAVSGAAWLLPSQNQWKAMFNANGGSDSSWSGLNSALVTAGGDSSKFDSNSIYWTSTENTSGNVYSLTFVGFTGDARWDENYKSFEYLVRACLAF